MPELSRAPSYFCCQQCRSSIDFYGERHKRIHENTRARTGRERKAKGNRNIRMLGVHLEYVCTCGYRGWSKHQGMMRLPHNGEVAEGPLYLAEKKARSR